MDNLIFIKIVSGSGIEEEHAVIDRGNNEFISMPKSEYDRQQAEQSTPNLPA